jgi:hypothetical protein
MAFTRPQGAHMTKSKNQIITYTGVYMDPFQMTPEQVRILDIAHSLSLISRANGHIAHFFSVAQHCINCAREAECRGLSRRVQLACLLHDASECYLSDVIRPVKHRLPGYAEAEDKVTAVIERALDIADLSEAERRSVREIDDAMLYWEFVALAGVEIMDAAPFVSMRHDFSFRDMAAVRDEFIALAEALGGARRGFEGS